MTGIGHRKLARTFNLCHSSIDDLILFTKKKFFDYLRDIFIPSGC